jgi:hypothetical protein
MAQSGSREVEVCLNLAGRRPFFAALDDEAHDGESDRVTESSELLGVAFELGGHA